MRRLFIAGSLVAAMAVPAVADAQTRCERQNSTNRLAGTVVGGGIGALLGSAIAGNSSNTAGTIVGGLAGAIAGNQIAKRVGEPCPPGYAEVPAVAPPPGGPAAFWQGGPSEIRDRIAFMEDRIQRAERNDWINRSEARRAYDELAQIRRMESDMRRRDRGRLSVENANYLQSRLDTVGARVNWAQDMRASNERATASGYYNNNRGYYDSAGVWHEYARGYYDNRGVWHSQ